MLSLLWFEGITWETSIRDIGWTWLILAVLIIFIIREIVVLSNYFRGK